MKAISSFIVVSLISISSFACPNLTGQWLCDNFGSRTVVSLSLETNYGYERLVQVNDYKTPAEETIVYLINVGPQKISDIIHSATCDANSITVNVQEYLNSKKEFLLDVKYSFILTGSDSLIIDVISSNDNLIDPNSDVISCKRTAL